MLQDGYPVRQKRIATIEYALFVYLRCETHVENKTFAD